MAVELIFVRVSVIVTVAPAAAAPFESVIVPSSEPLTACPGTTLTMLTQINASNNSLFALYINSLLVDGCFRGSGACRAAADPARRRCSTAAFTWPLGFYI